MSTLSPAVPLGLADEPASSKEVWRRAFKLPDECVISADGDLSEEDAADRRLSPRGGYAAREQVCCGRTESHPACPASQRPWRLLKSRIKAILAKGYVDGRMAQAGIAPVISRCNIGDDRNERKSNSQLDLDGPQYGALRCALSANQMRGS